MFLSPALNQHSHSGGHRSTSSAECKLENFAFPNTICEQPELLPLVMKLNGKSCNNSHNDFATNGTFG